ncbi:MAG: lytic transglycosylase domain-containing protein [Deferribacterales bacterium]
MVERVYKNILYSFIVFLLFINTVCFITTFNPKAIINPFFIKSRTFSVYLLLKYIITETGLIIRSPSPEQLEEKIKTLSDKYRIDPELVKIVIQVESKYKKFAISRTGAIGLMQVMPNTFFEMGFQKPFDINENLEAGIKYLSIQLKNFKNIELALSAYNAGPSRVKNNQVPKIGETESYVKKITEQYSKIRTDYLKYNPVLQ